MKRVFSLFLFLFLMTVLFSSCRKGNEKAIKKVKTADGFVVIENEREPHCVDINLRYEEDLSITEEGWWPWELLVDEEYIYVLAEKENQMKKYNHDGVEISKKEFRKGRGPGEFQIMDPCLYSDGSLFISDFSQRRLTIIDAKYDIQNILKLDFWGQVFRLDSKGNLYFLTLKALPKTTSKHRVILTKYTPSGCALYEIDEYFWGQTYDKFKGKYLDELFRPQLKYKIDMFDNIYYAMTDKYEINIVSSKGELIRRIEKKGSPRKVTQEDIDKFMPTSSYDSRIRREYNIPNYMPSVADLFVLDNGYLLVITFENDISDPTLTGDLFDENGIYRRRIQIPKYYKWDFLLAPCKNFAICRNDYFYTLEADKDEENFYINRYKMIWEVPS